MVYVGLVQSAFDGALVLFLFSLGMGVPLVLAAVARARALPLLMKLDAAVRWMGLISAVIIGGFGILLVSGNDMVVAEWSQRMASGAGSLPDVPAGIVIGVAASLGLAAVLVWMTLNGRARSSQLF